MARKGGQPSGEKMTLEKALFEKSVDLKDFKTRYELGRFLQELAESDEEIGMLTPKDEAAKNAWRQNEEYRLAVQRFSALNTLGANEETFQKFEENVVVRFDKMVKEYKATKADWAYKNLAALQMFLVDAGKFLTKEVDRAPWGATAALTADKEFKKEEVTKRPPDASKKEKPVVVATDYPLARVPKTSELILDNDAKEIVRLEKEYTHYFDLLTKAGKDKNARLTVWRGWAEELKNTKKDLDDVQKGKKEGDEDGLELRRLSLQLFRDDKKSDADDFIDSKGELRAQYAPADLSKLRGSVFMNKLPGAEPVSSGQETVNTVNGKQKGERKVPAVKMPEATAGAREKPLKQPAKSSDGVAARDPSAPEKQKKDESRKKDREESKRFQPEKIDDEIFDEWRVGLWREHVLPLLKKTIQRFNEVFARNKNHAKEWAGKVRELYNFEIDPDRGKDRVVKETPTAREHKAWALITFLQAAEIAFKEGRPIPEDTTYYKIAAAPPGEGGQSSDSGVRKNGAEPKAPLLKEKKSPEKEIVAGEKTQKDKLISAWGNNEENDIDKILEETGAEINALKNKDAVEARFFLIDLNGVLVSLGNKIAGIKDNTARSVLMRKQLALFELLKLAERFLKGENESLTIEVVKDRISKWGVSLSAVENGAAARHSEVATADAAEKQPRKKNVLGEKRVGEQTAAAEGGSLNHPAKRSEGAGVEVVEIKEPQKEWIWSTGEVSEKKASHAVNQDSSFVDADARVIAVFDGLGGHDKGDVASSEAKKVVEEFAEKLRAADTVERVREIMRDAFKIMNEKVKASTNGGGTTATVAKIVRERDKQIAVIGNLGDSRAYIFRAKTKTLEQITNDDDFLSTVPESDPLWEYVEDIRKILSEAYNEDQLTKQDVFAKTFSYLKIAQEPDGLARLDEIIKNSLKETLSCPESLAELFGVRNQLTKYVGGNNEPTFTQTEFNPGDILFCTSDGVHDNLTNDFINEVMRDSGGRTPEDLADIIIGWSRENEKAKNLRSKNDDMTVVVLRGAESTAVAQMETATPIRKEELPPVGAVEVSKVKSIDEEVAREIEETPIYKELRALYFAARDNDAARRNLLQGWHAALMGATVQTDRIRAMRHILAQIDAGKFDKFVDGDGTADRATERGRDALYERLHSLHADTEARKEIEVGNEFNVAVIGTETFKKAELEEYNGRKIEIRLMTAKGVVPRKIEIGRVYAIRIVKINQSKEKRGGGKHYWHEAEVIGENLNAGDAFAAELQPPKEGGKPGQYLCFAPDGLPVFVNGPADLDRTKKYKVTITHAADFSGAFGAWRNHQGVLEGFEEFGRGARAGSGTTDLSSAAREPAEPLAWDIAPEKRRELAADRDLFMQMFPDGIVTRGIFERDDETGEPQLLPYGNLDAEACIFLLQNFFELPEEYLAKTKFVRPGEYKPNSLNVDTGFDVAGFQVKWFNKDELAAKGLNAAEIAGQKEEDKGGGHVVIVQDHGSEANRTMSAFKLLYDALIDRYGEDAIPPGDREPMKNFVRFVTHIDNFTAPDADFDWKKAWAESDKIPFMLALAKQNFLDIGELYQFFKEHPFADAFKRPSEWVRGGVPPKLGGKYDFYAETKALTRYGFDALGRVRKDGRQEPIMTEQFKLIERGNRYFEYLLAQEPEFVVDSSVYGKILVVLDGDHVPGRLAAAMAHGIDGMLEWRPGAQSFWFNMAPQKDPADYGKPQIPLALAEETGGVWVRGSIVMQPDWKKQDIKTGLNLGVFLEKIGVPASALRGYLQERVDAENASEKPWKTVPEMDFLAVKSELKQAVFAYAPKVDSVDPNQKIINGQKEEYFIRYFRRPNDFKNDSINIWVMAVHEWFNDQIMEKFMVWMDGNIKVTSVDTAAGTIIESDGTVSNKEQFVKRFEALPKEYSRASRGIWKGAVERWFDTVLAGKRAKPLEVLLKPVQRRQYIAPKVKSELTIPEFKGEDARAKEPVIGYVGEKAPAEAANVDALETEISSAETAEDARVADAVAELEQVTERLARARAAKEQYEGIVKGFAGFISGNRAQAETEYDAALQEYQNATERLIGGALTEGLKWRTRLVEKMIDAQLAMSEKKGIGDQVVGVWKALGEASLYNYIDKKGGWQDKRGFAWSALKILSKAANLRTATALSLLGGGWIAGATAVGWGAAGAGASLSALGSGIGFNEWLRHGYETGGGATLFGKKSASALAREKLFKNQAEAEAYYQQEYAGVGRFKKFWRGISGQGWSAEGAAAKAVWLDKLGEGGVAEKRHALAERLLALEADAVLRWKKDLASDASYQKLVETYKEAVAEEEQMVGISLDAYFEAQGKGFVDALDNAIGGEKSALRRRKVFSAFAGATLGFASLANFDVRSYIRGLGSEGKPPAGIVSMENAPTENAPAPQVPPASVKETPQISSVPPAEAPQAEVPIKAPPAPEETMPTQQAPSAPSVVSPMEAQEPSLVPPVETPRATAHSPFVDLIHQAQGERAWTGVRKVAGGEYAHIVPERGHRAVIQAVKELLHTDPQKFGMGAHSSDALVEAKATAIARKLGFMGHGYSLGFKFDAEHPIGLFAKDGQISVVAENEETLHRLMGAVKRGGGVMKPDAARPYVDSAFPKIRSHAIFVEGQSGAPVDATQVRVSAGMGHSVAPRAEGVRMGDAHGVVPGARASVDTLKVGELAPHVGEAKEAWVKAGHLGDIGLLSDVHIPKDILEEGIYTANDIKYIKKLAKELNQQLQEANKFKNNLQEKTFEHYLDITRGFVFALQKGETIAELDAIADHSPFINFTRYYDGTTTPIGLKSGAGVGKFGFGGGGASAGRDGGGGGGASATETVPAVDARPVFVRVIDGVKFEASRAYKPEELTRIEELAKELARQKIVVEEKLAFLKTSDAGKKLADSFAPKTKAFKDLLETFKQRILEGKTSVRDLEGLVNSSPLKEAAVSASEGAGGVAGFPVGADVGSRLSSAPAVEEGILKIANVSHRIVSDAKNHILSVWNEKVGSAVPLELPDAFDVTSRSVRGEPLAVSIVTPGGQRLKGVIKFVEGAAHMVEEEGKKKIDLPWEKFLKKY